MPETMKQEAPYPDVLKALVDRLEYRPGWRFALEDTDRGQGSKGLTFCAVGQYPDSYDVEKIIRVMHYFPVPPAAFNYVSWQRWLFERILDIERHESAEYFKIDGDRPYAPHHGPGNDPYLIFDHHDPDDVKIRFDGTVAETGSDQ